MRTENNATISTIAAVAVVLLVSLMPVSQCLESSVTSSGNVIMVETDYYEGISLGPGGSHSIKPSDPIGGYSACEISGKGTTDGSFSTEHGKSSTAEISMVDGKTFALLLTIGSNVKSCSVSIDDKEDTLKPFVLTTENNKGDGTIETGKRYFIGYNETSKSLLTFVVQGDTLEDALEELDTSDAWILGNGDKLEVIITATENESAGGGNGNPTDEPSKGNLTLKLIIGPDVKKTVS